jgi:hypothetical protein
MKRIAEAVALHRGHPGAPGPSAGALRAPHALSLAGLAGLFILLLAGCEESVDPVLDTGRAFTLYGFFNPASDTQAVRVFPIEETLAPTTTDPIDALITSTDLESGERHSWQDSLVQYINGTYGHVYWSQFRPEFGKAYRIVVERSDGAAAEATARVPGAVEPVVEEPVIQVGQVRQLVRWDGAPRLINLRLIYSIEVFRGNEAIDTLALAIPYEEQAIPTEAGWGVQVDYSSDLAQIVRIYVEAFGSLFNITFGLLDLELRVMVISEDWSPPGGVFDPDLLVEPGTFSNVENGFGFVGAGYPASVHWLLDPEVQREAGFRVR